jgi:hypothetical protein
MTSLVSTGYAKGHLSTMDRWIDRPTELRHLDMAPDAFPFILLRRPETEPPVLPPAFPRHEDYLGNLRRTGGDASAAYKMTYADETYQVDHGLMTRYFDAVFRLSTFIERECRDPFKIHNVVVFACRSPMYYDAQSQTFTMGDYMNVDSNVFIRNEIRKQASANYQNHMAVNLNNRTGRRCDPRI